MIIPLFSTLKAAYREERREVQMRQIYDMFSHFTMVPPSEFIRNLKICQKIETLSGAVVECGVWRGGMIGGIAKLLGNERSYYLFDSFEGLPPAQDVDGKAAKDWQANTTSESYWNNCKAEISFAQQAMEKALNGETKKVHFIKGWFNETLKETHFNEPIALLRLDGDWYESTMTCLEVLFPCICENGIIIIDDYYAWDGCSKAVHDYLSKHQRTERLSQYENNTAYIVKKK